jgi:hypothetical protein
MSTKLWIVGLTLAGGALVASPQAQAGSEVIRDYSAEAPPPAYRYAPAPPPVVYYPPPPVRLVFYPRPFVRGYGYQRVRVRRGHWHPHWR